MKFNQLLIPGLAGAMLTLAACNGKKPGEDSVATVDGYEITLPELKQELSESGVQDTDDPVARRAALQAIINRKLLSQLAEKNELDRTPDYILKEQRMHDVLLADAAVKSLAPESSRSNKQQIDAFLNDNLGGGTARTLYAVDALQFQRPSKPEIMNKLQTSKSLEEIVQILRDAKIQPQAGRLTWDSANMPTELVSQINKLPGSEPFLIPEGNGIVAGVIRDRRQVPIDPKQARALAQAAVSQQTIRTRVTDWLQQSRNSAKINYSEGYAPTASPAASGSPRPAASSAVNAPNPT